MPSAAAQGQMAGTGCTEHADTMEALALLSSAAALMALAVCSRHGGSAQASARIMCSPKSLCPAVWGPCPAVPLPATGTELWLHTMLPSLWCSQASAVPQAAVEALEPPGHIHPCAAVDCDSCTHLLGSLSSRTAVVSVLSTEQCPHPGLAAAHQAEQATRAAARSGADPSLHPSPSIIWGCPLSPCIAERRKAQQEHTPSLLGSHAAPNPCNAAGHTSSSQPGLRPPLPPGAAAMPPAGTGCGLRAARPGAGGSVTVRLLAGLAAGCRAALEGALAVAIGLAAHGAVRCIHRRARAHAGFGCKAKVGPWAGGGGRSRAGRGGKAQSLSGRCCPGPRAACRDAAEPNRAGHGLLLAPAPTPLPWGGEGGMLAGRAVPCRAGPCAHTHWCHCGRMLPAALPREPGAPPG